MKYATLFQNTSSADGFKIVNIPWVGWENQREKTLHCNEPNKQIIVDSSGNIEYVNVNQKVLLNQNKWYDHDADSMSFGNIQSGLEVLYDNPDIATCSMYYNSYKLNDNNTIYRVPSDAPVGCLFSIMFYAILEKAWLEMGNSLSTIPKIPIICEQWIIEDGGPFYTKKHSIDCLHEYFQCTIDNINEIIYYCEQSTGETYDSNALVDCCQSVLDDFDNSIDSSGYFNPSASHFYNNILIDEDLLEKFTIHSQDNTDIRYFDWAYIICGWGLLVKNYTYMFKVKYNVLQNILGEDMYDFGNISGDTQIMCFGQIETAEGPHYMYYEANGQQYLVNSTTLMNQYDSGMSLPLNYYNYK